MNSDHLSPSFVDRDMFMRFRGGGIGHKSTNEATRCAYEDRDVMDTTDYEPDDSDDEEAAFDELEQTSDEDPGNLSDLGESERERWKRQFRPGRGLFG
jgi:hypothetical protein